MKLKKCTKQPSVFEPEAGTPNECFANVYNEVTSNDERTAILGYIFKDGNFLEHCWYMELDGTVVDMTLPAGRGWKYKGYLISFDEWFRRVQEKNDGTLTVLTDEEKLGLGIVVERYNGARSEDRIDKAKEVNGTRRNFETAWRMT